MLITPVDTILSQPNQTIMEHARTCTHTQQFPWYINLLREHFECTVISDISKYDV